MNPKYGGIMAGVDFDMSNIKAKHVGAFSPDLIRQYSDWFLEKRLGKCDVHWGRHSCNHKRGHDSGDYPRPGCNHECVCGAKPENYSVLWGRDLTPEELEDLKYCQEELAYHESQLSRYDEFDRGGNYRGPTVPGSRYSGEVANKSPVTIRSGRIRGSIVTGYSE